MSILKKVLNNTMKKNSDKTSVKQINLYFIRDDIRQVNNETWYQVNKGEQKGKSSTPNFHFLTANFTEIKTSS